MAPKVLALPEPNGAVHRLRYMLIRAVHDGTTARDPVAASGHFLRAQAWWTALSTLAEADDTRTLTTLPGISGRHLLPPDAEAAARAWLDSRDDAGAADKILGPAEYWPAEIHIADRTGHVVVQRPAEHGGPDLFLFTLPRDHGVGEMSDDVSVAADQAVAGTWRLARSMRTGTGAPAGVWTTYVTPAH